MPVLGSARMVGIMAEGLLLVMAKAPEAGRVKTRLARGVGAAQAVRLAEAFLADTWRSARRHAGTRPVLVLDGALRPETLAYDPPVIWDQGQGDLGQRLERAIRRALDLAPWAIVIGTDSPGRPPHLVDAAIASFTELPRPDAGKAPHAVLGPTTDGGFYLIGVDACPSGLLAGLPWSEEITFQATQSRLISRGFSVTTLAEWFDVDEAEDLPRLRRVLRQRPEAAPRTHDVLGEI